MHFLSKHIFTAIALSVAMHGSFVFATHSDFDEFKKHCLILQDGKRAINPATGKPFVFWFVNNQATPPGNGTFEAPFPTLDQASAAAKPFDIIYVYYGDGTDTGMNNAIILEHGQQLLGAGICQKLKTEQGTVKIPAQSTGLPTISDNGIDHVNPTIFAAVQLSAGDNVVSGFNLVDTLAYFAFNCPPQPLNSSGALNIYGGINYVIKNNVLNVYEFPAGSGNVGTAMNVFGGGFMKIAHNTFVSQAGNSDNYGILLLNGAGSDFFCVSTPFVGTTIIKKNEIRGADATSGFTQGIHTNIFIQEGDNVCFTIVDNLIDSASNTTPGFELDNTYGMFLQAIQLPQQTTTFNVVGNIVYLPANAVIPTANIAIAGYGSGTTIANVHDNVATNSYGVPAYTFDNNGNVDYLKFKAESGIKCSKKAQESKALVQDLTKYDKARFIKKAAARKLLR